MAPLPESSHYQSHHRNGQEANNKPALEPVECCPAIQNDLQAGEAEGYQKNSKTVNSKLPAFAGSFNLTCELWRLGNQPIRQDQRYNPDGDVDKKNPSPAPVVRDPATQRRPDHRGRYDGHAVESNSSGPLMCRERIYQNGLLDRSEAAASHALQNAKED